MRPYLITAKLMRPSNMKRFPTPVIGSMTIRETPRNKSKFRCSTGGIMSLVLLRPQWLVCIKFSLLERRPQLCATPPDARQSTSVCSVGTELHTAKATQEAELRDKQLPRDNIDLPFVCN